MEFLKIFSYPQASAKVPWTHRPIVLLGNDDQRAFRVVVPGRENAATAEKPPQSLNAFFVGLLDALEGTCCKPCSKTKHFQTVSKTYQVLRKETIYESQHCTSASKYPRWRQNDAAFEGGLPVDTIYISKNMNMK